MENGTFWDILFAHNGHRVLITLYGREEDTFAFDGIADVEVDGAAPSMNFPREGNLHVWLDGLSEDHGLLNIVHRQESKLTELPHFAVRMPLFYEDLLVRVVRAGRPTQVWPV